jgi:6-pyruvoyl-tetrahydropterin synthase related domain
MNTGNLLAAEDRISKFRWSGGLSPAWLVVTGAVIAMLPAVFYGIPGNVDLLNHFRFALPFYDAIQQGNLHPSWLAESNFGYGDTSFRFYPPALYYLLAIGRALSGSWYIGTLSVLVVLSVAGSIGVYFWARQFLPGEIAMWAGLLYSVAPYHTNQLYQAFLLAEFAGAAVLPFGFAFVLRVCKRGSPLDIAGLSLSLTALILTHLPLSVIGSVALVVYAVICLERRTRWSTILRLTCAVLLALAASSFYWTTMLAELKWIRAYDSQSVEFSQNFLFKTLSPDNLNVWWMNIIFVTTLLMFWPAFVLLRHWKGQQSQQRTFNGVALLMFFSIFMATPISWPVWKVLSPIQQVQFPWRWLGVTSMAFAVMLPVALPFWRKRAMGRKRVLVLIAGGTFAIALAFSISHIVREAQYLNAGDFDSTLRSIPGTQGVWQWWPIWVQTSPKSMTTPVDAGSRSFVVDSWEPERRVFRVSPGQAGDIRVRTFFYPHWVATANGASLSVRPDQDGALLISIPETALSVLLEFKEPPRVRIAVYLSFIGWAAIAGLALVNARKKSPANFEVR